MTSQMTSRRRGPWALFSVASLILFVGACAPMQALSDAMTQQILGTLYVAVDLPQPDRLGALFAIEQADRASNAVGGFRIAPYVVDPPSVHRADALANLKRVLDNRKVLALIGPSTAEAAEAIVPKADLNGVFHESMAVISPYLLDPCLTHATPACPPAEPNSFYPKTYLTLVGTRNHVYNFFRLSPTSDDEGGAAADYAANVLDATNALVLTGGAPADAAFGDQFTQRFVAVRQQKVFQPAAKLGYEAALDSARSAGVDLVVYAGPAAAAGRVRALMRKAGFPLSVPMLGGPDLRSADFRKAAGPAAQGSYAVDPMIDADQWDPAADLLTAFRQRHPAPADFNAGVVYAYDATNAFLAAFRSLVVYQPVAPSRDDVIAGLRDLNHDYTPGQPHQIWQPVYDGILGRFTFGSGGGFSSLSRPGEPSVKLFSYWTYSAQGWTLDDQGPYRG